MSNSLKKRAIRSRKEQFAQKNEQFAHLLIFGERPERNTHFFKLKSPGLGIRSFQKNGTIFAFFSILYKRMEPYLHSFPFFIKERNVHFGFISYTKIANLAKKRK